MQGYIKDHRKELDSDIWMMPPLYHRTWQYLKYVVNHHDNKIPMRDGSFLTIKAGQHLTSVREIARAIGWYEGVKYKEPNPKTVSTILEWMEKQSMIAIERGKGNRQYTLITLINWHLYQQKSVTGNSQETAREQCADINNNDKECFKNELINDDDGGGAPATEIVQLAGTDQSKGQIPRSSLEQDLIAKYMQLAAIPGFDIPEYQKMAVRQVAESGILPENALKYLEECFQEFKPRHARDKINSFGYCATVILNKHTQAHTPQKTQPRKGHGKKVIRQEILPDWFDKPYKPPEEDPVEVEKRRKELEELLKQFRE